MGIFGATQSAPSLFDGERHTIRIYTDASIPNTVFCLLDGALLGELTYYTSPAIRLDTIGGRFSSVTNTFKGKLWGATYFDGSEISKKLTPNNGFLLEEISGDKIYPSGTGIIFTKTD